jgi:hypothetical protein
MPWNVSPDPETPIKKRLLSGGYTSIEDVQAIYEACAFIAEGPLRGHTRSRPLLICAVESAARKRGLTTLSPTRGSSSHRDAPAVDRAVCPLF